MRPVPYPVSTPYGIPGSWAAGVHTGEDYAAPEGTPVVAAGGGKVLLAEWQGDYGNRVDVQADGRQHSYSHLSRIDVQPGQELQPGQLVGLVGSTGRSTGPHLHYEERVSPYGYYNHAKPIYPAQDPPQPPAPDALEDDMFIIGSPNRAATLLAAGYSHVLNSEELQVLKDCGVRTVNHNDRGYDVAVAACMQGEQDTD